MKIGLMTESLGDMPFEAMLATCAKMGIESVEFGTGNWLPPRFIDLDGLIEGHVVAALEQIDGLGGAVQSAAVDEL